MDLVQGRFVTDDVSGLAAFYCQLTGSEVPANDYYVEVPAGAMTVGISRCRYTDYCGSCPASGARAPQSGEVILDFRVDDVDAEFGRIDRLGVEWVMRPATQPWGARSMTFRDPQGNAVNVFSPLHGDGR